MSSVPVPFRSKCAATNRTHLIQTAWSEFIVWDIHRLPTADDQLLENHLINNLDKVTKKYPSVAIIITGDFNRFKRAASLRSFHFKQIVTKPTRKISILQFFFHKYVEIL